MIKPRQRGPPRQGGTLIAETNDVRRDRRDTDQRASHDDDGLVIDMTDTRSTGLRPPEPASPLVRDSSYYLG